MGLQMEFSRGDGKIDSSDRKSERDSLEIPTCSSY